MRVYAVLRPNRLEEIPAQTQRLEALGFDGVCLLEQKASPTLAAAVVALNSTKLSIMTGILVAFPRSPMVTAYDAWALQSLSKGRLQLGLGSQTKGHLQRRWGTGYLPPAPRMREYAQALDAIWNCWQEDTPLNFQGRYYSFSLMIPYYNPGPIDYPRIPLYLSAVNKYMCRLTGEFFQGHIPGDPVTHKFIQEAILPNLEEGARRNGRSLGDLDLGSSGFIGCGNTESDLEEVRNRVRERVALYACTPTYKAVLDLHGWGDLLPQLTDLFRKRAWSEMGSLVTDEMLEQYAVFGRPEELPALLQERFGGHAHRIHLDDEWFVGVTEDQMRQLVEAIQRL